MSESRSAWTEPGVQDIGGGVYRIPLPLPNDGLKAVNVYALRSEDGLVLIDSGWALTESADLLKSSLGSIDSGLSDITDFLVTHVHRDHYTQAVAVRREFGTRISLGIGERPGLTRIIEWANGVSRPDMFHVLRRFGAPPVAEYKPPRDGRSDFEQPDLWLTDDDRLTAAGRELRVIHTPGHTAGHVVFHDEAADLLFAGDHVLPQITPSIGFEPIRTPFPLRDYLDSLKLMFTLPDATLLPAHGPVTSSVHERVTELLAHHADRLDASQAVVVAGAATAYEAARALTWTRHLRTFESLDLMNKGLAIAETAAHLDVLVLQGRLASSIVDGVEIYRAA